MISRRTLLLSTVAGVVSPRGLFVPKAPDLRILHTNDLHGRVDFPDTHQGLTYLATLMRRLRREAPAFLTLDAGDIIHGTPVEWLEGPAPVIQALNGLGYDAITVGNHEFDFGPENLRRAERMARYPFLSANVRDAHGDPWGPLKPYVVISRAGRRIGIFGLTTETTPSIQWPRTIEQIKFTDAEAAARETVKTLREREKVDMVLCLSHLGYAPDRKLAHEAPGIDLIIGGHSHTRLERAVIEGGVPIVQTGAHGKALGVTDVRFEGGRPRFEYRLEDAERTVIRGGVVEGPYSPAQDRVALRLREKLATLSKALPIEGLRERRTELGAFLSESVRKAHGTDVGLFSSSQIGAGFAAGEVLARDVYDAMAAYTRQHIVRAEVTDELLTAQLEKAARPGAMTVQVAAPPIESGKRYSVAAPAHVMQDLFLGKLGARIIYDDPLGPSVRDAVIEGFRKQRF